MKQSIFISVNSGIGEVLAKHRLNSGYKVIGTYRNANTFTAKKEDGMKTYPLDIDNEKNLKDFTKFLEEQNVCWDELIICTGIITPIVEFESCKFSEWSNSFNTNFTSQCMVIRNLLHLRSKNNPLVVVFSAGGGKVNAGFSSYNIAKIALIKAIECFDQELSDCRFCAVGPGWLDTKIHRATLDNVNKSSTIYKETIRRIKENDFGSYKQMTDFFDWLSNQKKNVIGGRNISIQYDDWHKEGFQHLLKEQQLGGKLRRALNESMNEISQVIGYNEENFK